MVKGKFKKSPVRYSNGHYSRASYNKEQFISSTGSGDLGGLDRHALYESAVQSPKGDISFLLSFYQQYVGPQVPMHLREDFCGTALIAATWCRGDVRRTATGLDIDREALCWGLRHNGEGLVEGGPPRARLCLLQGDVRDPAPLAEHVVLAVSADVAQERDSEPALGSCAPDAGAQQVASAVGCLQLQGGQCAGEGGAPANCPQEEAAAATVSEADVTAAEPARTGSSTADEASAKQASRAANGRHLAALGSGPGRPRVAAEALQQRQQQQQQQQQPPPQEEIEESDAESAEADLRTRPADIVCAFNFSVCLLHARSDVQAYFQRVRRALDGRRGGVFVADLLGGHEAEGAAAMPRHNEVTGASFLWEQEAYDPVTRHIRAYITLRDPATRKMLRRAFQYNWRLWTIPELCETLMAAGFHSVHAWLRPMKVGMDDGVEPEGRGSSSGSSSTEGEEADFVEYKSGAFTTNDLQLLAKGWTAFIVGVVRPAA